MPILPQMPVNCVPAAGLEVLRLLFVLLLLLLGGMYGRNYPSGWAAGGPQQQKKRTWRPKPRSPEACEGCQKGPKIEVFQPRRDVAPHADTKSPRGRPKALSTVGYACPHPRCEYFGVTDESLHALVGNGKRGKNRDIRYWRCRACQKKFTSRLHTPLYRLKTDLEKVTLVLLLLANGCDLSMVVLCALIGLFGAFRA